MAYYHLHGLIPDGISQAEGHKMFEQYIASSAPLDKFEGFELITRFHDPETGEVFVTLKADNHLAISEHFGVWNEKRGKRGGRYETRYSKKTGKPYRHYF